MRLPIRAWLYFLLPAFFWGFALQPALAASMPPYYSHRLLVQATPIASPSPTPTGPQASLTPTPSATPSPTASPSPTPTPTATPTDTPSPTPTMNVSPPAVVVTPTEEPTPSPTHPVALIERIRPPDGLLGQPVVQQFYQSNHLTASGTILLCTVGGLFMLIGTLLLIWPKLLAGLKSYRLRVSPNSWYYRLTTFL